MLMTGAMILGAIGAVLPVVGHRSRTGRIRVAHLCMGVVMLVMAMFGMDAAIAIPAGLALVVAALYVTGSISPTSPSGPCVVDLTCMAVLLLLMPSLHTHSATDAGSAAPMHRHGAGLDPRIAVLVLLVAWIALTITMLHRRRSERPVAAGSLLMIFGMAPVAF
ncbi:hypothetical protein CH276_24190 [Rhodococcus sp. 06-470-2]|nr:hypothetical protein CH276_24190 [Rhodococcus sp. 06-470-2]OZE55064.1 hypothetical protein CH265_27745 [Rhodococcus sp. 05-2221-1B]